MHSPTLCGAHNVIYYIVVAITVVRNICVYYCYSTIACAADMSQDDGVGEA